MQIHRPDKIFVLYRDGVGNNLVGGYEPVFALLNPRPVARRNTMSVVTGRSPGLRASLTGIHKVTI